MHTANVLELIMYQVIRGLSWLKMAIVNSSSEVWPFDDEATTDTTRKICPIQMTCMYYIVHSICCRNWFSMQKCISEYINLSHVPVMSYSSTMVMAKTLVEHYNFHEKWLTYSNFENYKEVWNKTISCSLNWLRRKLTLTIYNLWLNAYVDWQWILLKKIIEWAWNLELFLNT